MRLCPACGKSAGNAEGRCGRCGYSLVHEPVLKGITEFGNPGAEVMNRIHRRHRRMNLRNAVVLSVLIQVGLAAALGMVHDWTLAVHGLFAAAMAVAVHRLRCGHLTTVLASGFGCILVYYWTGHLTLAGFLPAMFSLWLLVFWYTFLGYQLKMNNELHGKDLSA